MKPLLLLALILTTHGLAAQCNVFRYHPVWPDTLGSATFSNPCPESVDAVQWDDGSTDWTVNDLAPGEHWVDLYFNGALVTTLPFTIDQVEWQLGSYSWTSDGALLFGINLALQWCPGSSLFNHIDCMDLSTCMLYLMQDGVPIDSVVPTGCVASTHLWTGLPFGHTYQGYLVDQGPCGSYGWSDLLNTYSCAGAQLDIHAEPATNGNNGSIEVLGVLLDPGATNPPPGPITGSFRLFNMPLEEPIGDWQSGTGAFWSGLPPGDYQVRFIADAVCDPVSQEVSIELGTSTAEAIRQGPFLGPNPVHDVLVLDTEATRVRISDLHGRLLLQARNTDRLDVSTLAPGVYLLHLEGRRAMRFVKG